MKEIDLSSYSVRTDLVVDLIKDEKINERLEYEENGIVVSRIVLNEEEASKIGKKAGDYTTIYYQDVTDNTNFSNVKSLFMKELKRILLKEGLNEDSSVLFIGLGNSSSTPDAIGPKTVQNLLITKHIYDLVGSLEEGFMKTSALSPGVMGVTGIETSDIISGVIEKVNPDFLIVVDALASDSIDRVLKTIQITNTGINPGSGIGNKRKEVSCDIYHIPTIAIGIPTVVDAVTIVSDTINYMKKHFSYSIKNKDNLVDKLIPSYQRNYLNQNNLKLSEEETTYFLGALGELSLFEQKALIYDVLTPIGYNLMVTPKEVDFLVLKLSKLLSEGINEILHTPKTGSDINL